MKKTLLLAILILSACGSSTVRATSEEPEELRATGTGPANLPKTATPTADHAPYYGDFPIHIVDTGISPKWKLEETAELWNTATGCEIFSFERESPLAQVVTVEQTNLPEADYWGEFTVGANILKLNIAGGKPNQSTTLHELGHTFGLPELNGIHDSIMNQYRTTSTLSQGDIESARKLNKYRCL